MPIYEFRCAACGRITSLFTRSVNAAFEERCGHCGSERVHRVPPRVARHRSTVRAADGRPDGETAEDPRQIGRWVERRFDEMGLELPREARTMIDAAREGEFPEPVKDL
jgi:putative FmdB family regulatory protein